MTHQASSSNEVRRFVRRVLDTSASIVLGAVGALRAPSLLMRALVVGVVLAAPLAAGLWVAQRVLALGPRDAPLSELMLSLVRLSLWARGMDVLRLVVFALAAPFTWSLALAAQGRRAPPRSYVGYAIRTIVRIALVDAVKSTRYLPDALLVLVFLDHMLDAPRVRIRRARQDRARPSGGVCRVAPGVRDVLPPLVGPSILPSHRSARRCGLARRNRQLGPLPGRRGAPMRANRAATPCRREVRRVGRDARPDMVIEQRGSGQAAADEALAASRRTVDGIEPEVPHGACERVERTAHVARRDHHEHAHRRRKAQHERRASSTRRSVATEQWSSNSTRAPETSST